MKIAMRILTVVMFLFAVAGCKKEDDISPIPAITFKSLIVGNNGIRDTAAILTFSYIDGDGDLGVLSDQTTEPYNLKIATYERVNGTFVYLINQDGYIPNLTPKARNKSISGDITDILQLPLNKTNDTLHYEVYIVDRAGNESNKIITPDIVVNTK